jgi:hypothetical protein
MPNMTENTSSVADRIAQPISGNVIGSFAHVIDVFLSFRLLMHLSVR